MYRSTYRPSAPIVHMIHVNKVEEVKKETPSTKPQPAKPETTKHEINLAVLTIVVGGLAWYMFR